MRALSFFDFPSKTDITLASLILNRLQKPSNMPHSPPLQQRLPPPAPANPHQPTPNLSSADQHQAIPRNPESTAPSGAELSSSQLHVSFTTSPRAISTSNRLLPTPPSHPIHCIYTADIHSNGQCIGRSMFC